MYLSLYSSYLYTVYAFSVREIKYLFMAHFTKNMASQLKVLSWISQTVNPITMSFRFPKVTTDSNLRVYEHVNTEIRGDIKTIRHSNVLESYLGIVIN